VHLTIDSAEQLPAAEAVIAAMYGVPDAISSLEQQQVVHAVVIADMMHAETVAKQALQALQAAAKLEHGPTAAALHAMAGLSVWPACLLQLLPIIVEHAPCCKVNTTDLAAITAADVGGRIQQLLVAALGDLQAVWSDSQLHELLLGLPLPAMHLLFSSDQLRLPSEDTVLYTAKQYVWEQVLADDEAAAKAVLAQLVRAPQLSLFALSCTALAANSDEQLLGAYAKQSRALLSFKRIAPDQELVAAEVADWQDAPSSWRLGPRQTRPLADGVRLEWRLPVEHLKQACRDSFAQQEDVQIRSPNSAPLGGVGWQLCVVCAQEEGGTVLGLFVVQEGVPADIYYKSSAAVCHGLVWLKHSTVRVCVRAYSGAWTGTLTSSPWLGTAGMMQCGQQQACLRVVKCY
jgi:hypothetical protein